MKTMFHFAAAAILIGWIGSVSAEESQDLDVAAQSLSTSLQQVAEDFDLTIAFYSESTDGIEAPPLDGTYTSEQALESLLADTNLEYAYVNESSVAVRPVAAIEEEAEAGKFQPTSNQTLMAQNQTSAQEPRNSEQVDTGENEDDEPAIDEIVTTGTRIRGVAPAGSPTITIDREAIELGGFQTTDEIFRSLPQNFVGETGGELAAAVVNGRIGTSAASENRSGAAGAVNLRGLGASATLTVLNGRRLAPAGRGAFVDLSVIPVSAIERVEILTDGASAIYGADAVGGVTNIILRKDFDGAETSINYGTVTDGDHDNVRLSQLFGKTWDTGNFFASYEYYDRSPLDNADRPQSLRDLRPLGGDDFRDPFSNPGTILAGISFAPVQYPIPEGQDGTSLTTDDFIGLENMQNRSERFRELLTDSQRHTGFLAYSQSLGDDIELMLEGRFTKLENELSISPHQSVSVPSTNPFFVDPSPTGSSNCSGFAPPCVRVLYNFEDDIGRSATDTEETNWGGSAGISAGLFSDWRLDLFASYGSSDQSARTGNRIHAPSVRAAVADTDPATALNLFGDGSNTNPATLDTIRQGFIEVESSYEVWSVDAVLDGSLFEIPGGAVKAAIGASYREEELTSGGGREFLITPTPETDPKSAKDRSVTAVFAEFHVPLIGDGNSVPLVERLELSAAVRYDDYSDFGSTTNEKFGLLWSLTRNFDFRASYGTSFRAPLLLETDINISSTKLVIPDFSSFPNLAGQLFLLGNNSELQEETATTWTAGFDYRPEWADGLSIEVTYFDVDYDDRIFTPPTFTLLNREDEFGDLITRPDEVDDFTAFVNDLAYENGDPTGTCLVDNGCFFVPLVNVVADGRITNLATLRVSGVDFSTNYRMQTDRGTWRFGLNMSYLAEFERAVSETAPVFDVVNTYLEPTDLRMRGTIGWGSDGIGVTAFVNYTGDYVATLNSGVPTPGDQEVGSLTTVDLNLTLNLGERLKSSVFDGTRLALNARNLLDEEPPFLNGPNGGYDPTKGSVVGRFLSLQLTKDW